MFTRLISGISSSTSFSVVVVVSPLTLFPASTQPSSSPLSAVSFPQYSSIAFARFLHGTFLVTRYCFSSGRYVFLVFVEPLFCHFHVGHVSTRKSPALTKSSGASVPFSETCPSFDDDAPSLGTEDTDSTADLKTEWTECRIPGGIKCVMMSLKKRRTRAVLRCY